MNHRYLNPEKATGTAREVARAVEDLHRRVSLLEATPEAAELADAEGVDLSKIDGTGEDGRVLKGDVAAFLEERAGS